MKKTKRCPTCSETKLVGEFSKNKRAKDGLQDWCKACMAAYGAAHKAEKATCNAAYYAANKEAIAAYNADRNATPHGRALQKAAGARSHAKFPQRIWCRSQFNNAITAGKIQRQACINGCTAKAEGHHADYSRPFDVEWLCKKCHVAWHKDPANKFFFNLLNSLREILRTSKAA